MDERGARTGWWYWEAGLLCSLLAVADTPVETVNYGAYAMVAMLFMFGLVNRESFR